MTERTSQKSARLALRISFRSECDVAIAIVKTIWVRIDCLHLDIYLGVRRASAIYVPVGEDTCDPVRCTPDYPVD